MTEHSRETSVCQKVIILDCFMFCHNFYIHPSCFWIVSHRIFCRDWWYYLFLL